MYDQPERKEEQRNEQEQRNEGLSTAALAGVGERVPAREGGVESAQADPEQATPLFSSDEAKDLRARWDGIQGAFVDEPRQAVEKADNLVAEAMKRLAEMFAQERAKLEGQWDRGDNVSTGSPDCATSLSVVF